MDQVIINNPITTPLYNPVTLSGDPTPNYRG